MKTAKKVGRPKGSKESYVTVMNKARKARGVAPLAPIEEKRGPMSEAHRKAISLAMKKRWRKVKQERVDAGDFQKEPVVYTHTRGSNDPIVRLRTANEIVAEIQAMNRNRAGLLEELAELMGE